MRKPRSAEQKAQAATKARQRRAKKLAAIEAMPPEQAYSVRQALRAAAREKETRWRHANWDKIRERQLKWRQENRESCRNAVRKYQLKESSIAAKRRRHGIRDPELVPATLIFQGHKCAICARDSTENCRLAADHDHISGLLRGMLCGRCNMGIGLLQESVDVLRAAVAFLENPPATKVRASSCDQTE